MTVFIHGFNTNWADAARRDESICARMFDGEAGIGIRLLLSWPSDGLKLGYLPDRMDPERTAPDLSQVLHAVCDWMAAKQVAGASCPFKACRAKTSTIADGMGNDVSCYLDLEPTIGLMEKVLRGIDRIVIEKPMKSIG